MTVHHISSLARIFLAFVLLIPLVGLASPAGTGSPSAVTASVPRITSPDGLPCADWYTGEGLYGCTMDEWKAQIEDSLEANYQGAGAIGWKWDPPPVAIPVGQTSPYQTCWVYTDHSSCYAWTLYHGGLAGVPPQTPERNLGPPCACAGDPINVGTGNEYRDDQDAALGTLSFHRYYNSHGAVASAHIGSHWRHSFDRRLQYLQNSSPPTMTAFRPDGLQVVFTQSGGQWKPTSDVADQLTQLANASGPNGWRYFHAATRTQEDYDTSGNLLSITTPDGQVTVLTYSTSSTPVAIAPVAGLLLTVTDPRGRSLGFTYNAAGNVVSVALPDGGALGYAYDTNGNLASVTYPDSKVRSYIYNESALTSGASLPHALTGDMDEAGARLTSIGYDTSGRAISSNLAGNVDVTAVAYNSSGTTTVSYPSGSQTTLNFVGFSGRLHTSAVSNPCGTACGQPNASATLDSNGYTASITDFNGAVATTAYNSFGLLTQVVDAKGQSSQRTTNTTWDTSLRMPLSRAVQDANGTTVAATSWVYNAAGQPLARCEVDPAVSGASSYTCAVAGTLPAGVRRWTYTYCTVIDTTQCPLVGLLLSETGPRADLAQITTYSYYLTDSATAHHGDLKSITNALGQVIAFDAYDGAGRIIRQRDANGVVMDSTYHARGWLLTRTVRANADGTPSANDAITQIGYTPYGAVASVKDPDGIQVTYTYDAAHRLTDITDALGNRIHYTLDAAGNKAKEETFDAGNTLRRSLARSYNTLGQLTGIKDGLSRTVFDASFTDSYDANGNLVRSADALGIQRKQGYDALNRLVSTIDNYNGTDTATQNTQSVFAYDAKDQLQGVSDPDGLNTTYDYDGLGNAKAVHSPDTGTSSYLYDAAGNRIQATDARGVVSHSSFDALNRLTATTYPTSDANVSYRYDEADSVTGCMGSYPIGRLTSVVEAAVTTVYCYDARGNVVQKRQTQGTNVDTISYTYTLADRLASTRTPDGTLIQYSRDVAGRINGITAQPPGSGSAGNVVTNVSYLPFGPIASYTLGNGQTLTRTYDANYAVTDIVSPALNLHFARDAMGNITALGNAAGANPAIETYSYDPLYRLTGLKDAQGQAIEVYTYNKTGDRLSKTSNGLATGTYGYQAGTHWLTSIGSSARTYDANGNTTGNASGGDTFGYGYNDRNRMTVVQRNGQTVGSYTYNALGQRVGKVATTNQRFAYDEGSQLLGEYGATSRTYVWLGNLPVAMLDTNGVTTTVSYVHADGMGTPRAITDGASATTWQWNYQSNPFGEKVPSGAMAAINLRFPGQYYDAEAALVYNIRRSYDAASGRYVQSDPIGLRGGISTYAYASSSPMSNVDPLGLDDSGCVINRANCGWPEPVPATNGVFVFGSLQGGTPIGPVHGEVESVALAGYSPAGGGYTGIISAGGGYIGGESNNAGYYHGKESLSDGTETSINLWELNAGPEVPGLAGVSAGGGVFTSCDEWGFYIHASGGGIGEHGALGIGFSFRR